MGTPDGAITWQLLGRRCERSPAGRGPVRSGGGRAQLRDPSPLPRASRRASFSAAGGARGGSLLSLREAQTL